MKKVFLGLSLAFFIYSCGSNQQQGAPIEPADTEDAVLEPVHVTETYKEQINIIDSLTRKTLQRQNNGAFLIAKNGNIIFEKYVGTTQPRKGKDSINAHTSFHIASVSKTLTAGAILQLVQEGQIELNDPVQKYLPSFPSNTATIESLLNHRSGLPTYDHFMENYGWNTSEFVHNQDVLDFLAKNHTRIGIRTANKGFTYSNTNYALLALIIERVSGMTYPDYMQKKIFQPLEMNDTYVFQYKDSASHIPSYYANGRLYKFDYLDYVYGDKNIYSTVRDLLKWDQALKHGFINDSLLNKAYSPYSFEKPGTLNYGLGWRMKDFPNKKRIIYHNGWWHGSRAALYRCLDEDVTLIALSNNNYPGVYEIRVIADIFGEYYQGGKYLVSEDE